MTTIEQREQQVTWHAMGSECTVILYSHDGRHASMMRDALSLVQMRVEILEQAWSRFRPFSELSQLNRQAGTGPVLISGDLMELVSRMKEAWTLTQGLYDPTVYQAMMYHGYTTSLTDLPWDTSAVSGKMNVPGMDGVIVDEKNQTVSLPAGIQLDPGGIGKGLAADILARELATLQFDGLLINLGGDIVLAGSPLPGADWTIARDSTDLGETHGPDLFYTIASGNPVAIATSGARSRRWGNGRHHLIDPRTGAPSHTALHQVTVIASCGWEAEAHTTAALLKEDGAEEWLHRHDLTGTLLYANGRIHHVTNTESTVTV